MALLQLMFFSPIIAAVVALIVFILVKMIRRGSELGTLLREALVAGLILGAIGFVLGFLGPIIYGVAVGEDSPQGPMLGIFITGPLGLALGIIIGTAKWAYQSIKSG